MIETLSQYQPKFKKLICVDSDGCAIDSMTIKHERAFGPALVNEWQLDDIKEAVLQRWNAFNLYEITKGSIVLKASKNVKRTCSKGIKH